MASSYSSDLKLELMVTGENAGTWGDKTNTNLNLIQQAVAGFEQVTLSSGGTLALVMSDGALSNARNLVIKFATASIAASTVCTIPDSIEKFYIFDCTGLTNPTNLTIKTASGTGFSPDAAKIYAAYSDGTNLNEVSLDTLGGTVAAAQIADGAITTDKIGDDQVTFAKMQDTTTANRVLGAVSAGTIGEVQVQSAMIADNAVGADQLADTSVSAGPYTTANITVDAQGRITAASSGAGGDGSYYPRAVHGGPSSGNFSTPANASKYYAFVHAGGGGGGGGRGENSQHGGSGGQGGFGFYAGSVQASTTYAWGAGGPGGGGSNSFGNGSPGQNGGPTFITGLFTVNAGNAGSGATPNTGPTAPSGSQGSAPGSTPGPSIDRDYLLYGASAPGTPGRGAYSPSNGNNEPGGSGGKGQLTFYDDGG